MLLKEFPNITWLKNQIAENFRSQLSWKNEALASPGWPTVILNATVGEMERPEIKGPLSLFVNLKGQSQLKVGRKELTINEFVYSISNKGETYSLSSQSSNPTETFNVHFGDQFSSLAIKSLSQNDEYALDEPFEGVDVNNIAFRSLFRSLDFDQKLWALKRAYQKHSSKDEIEEKLFDLFELVWKQNHRDTLRHKSIDALKPSTRVEIMKRLYLAVDYMHSSFTQKLNLDDLAAVSCLSKFHFVRLFREAFKMSPYQYLKSIRLNKARQLILQGEVPINQISLMVGYENSSSLSRAYFQLFGIYPSQEVN